MVKLASAANHHGVPEGALFGRDAAVEAEGAATTRLGL